MKFLVVLAVAIACASADVSHVVKDESNADVIRSEFDQSPEGAFNYVYETANGIAARAEGVVQNADSESPSLAVSGSYRYTAPDGTPVELSYIADADGFKPVGSHLPVAPPLPEAIARSLAYQAAKAKASSDDDEEFNAVWGIFEAVLDAIEKKNSNEAQAS